MVNPISIKIREKKLGVLIKDARLAAGLNMKDCAKAIGVTSERFKAFENGEKSPSLPEIETLAFFLDVPTQHFWGHESLSDKDEEYFVSSKMAQFIVLRTKIVGALVSRTRVDAELSLKELAGSIGITPRKLKSYETGENSIPLPELEVIATHMGLPIEHFQDKGGIVGRWAHQKKSFQEFLDLPRDIQNFVTKPINLPYLEIANKLSDLSTEKLRDVAESILEITL
jgi:transcriptional regulator with XRE-family HTH domain